MIGSYLQVAYTRLPGSAGPGYSDRGPLYLPLIDIALSANGKTCGAKGLVDTGSSFTLFGSGYADALGIDWSKGRQARIAGIAGQIMEGFVCDVEMILLPVAQSWPARVCFSPDLRNFPHPLLGHMDFLQHFEARFKGRQHKLRLYYK